MNSLAGPSESTSDPLSWELDQAPEAQACLSACLMGSAPLEIDAVFHSPTRRQWKVSAGGSRLVLSQTIERLKEGAFASAVALHRLAAERGLAPKLYGWSIRRQALLIQYIEPHPLPPYRIDPEPYQLALSQLRNLQSASTLRFEPEPGAENPYLRSPARVQETARRPSSGLSSESSTRASSGELPVDQTVVLHGNFHLGSVIFSRPQGTWQVHITDFNAIGVGHRLFDVARFVHDRPPEERLALLESFLKTRASAEDQRQLVICSQLLQTDGR